MSHNLEQKESLQSILNTKVEDFLKSFDSSSLTNFYEMYLAEVEPALLESVMQKCKYNQVRAAKMLGVSRGTLRKKLKLYFDDKYCSTRDAEQI